MFVLNSRVFVQNVSGEFRKKWQTFVSVQITTVWIGLMISLISLGITQSCYGAQFLFIYQQLSALCWQNTWFYCSEGCQGYLKLNSFRHKSSIRVTAHALDYRCCRNSYHLIGFQKCLAICNCFTIVNYYLLPKGSLPLIQKLYICWKFSSL